MNVWMNASELNLKKCDRKKVATKKANTQECWEENRSQARPHHRNEYESRPIKSKLSWHSLFMVFISMFFSLSFFWSEKLFVLSCHFNFHSQMEMLWHEINILRLWHCIDYEIWRVLYIGNLLWTIMSRCDKNKSPRPKCKTIRLNETEK